tara:strand:+ start:12691 stop:13770 length:1080 start_codon:yes stop_codon:yes gene_type:complete
MFDEYKGKKVLITGHTGFKGSWLSAWLINLGSEVYGISDDIPTSPSNFEAIKLQDRMQDFRVDLLDLEKIKKIIYKIKPDYVFHLGAQALVKLSYENPLKTININAIGTANILESLREIDHQVNLVTITSDKAYDNLEIERGYKETDILGGKDPYSASKGMAELVIKTYFHSFFKEKRNNIRIGVTRAGNVIGGGDWAKDRIVPDCMKAWAKKETVQIRNPESTRPWQHVLEPLGGYLLLGIILAKKEKINGEAFNFGPSKENNFSVIDLLKEMQKYWPEVMWKNSSRVKEEIYEAKLLRLNCEKAERILNWKPILSFEETAKITVDWYKKFYYGEDMLNISLEQIKFFTELLKIRNQD